MSEKSKYVDKTIEEIGVAAQLTALRTLHKLTGIMEDQLPYSEPNLAVVAAFHQAVEPVDKLGVDAIRDGVVSVLRDDE